MSVLDKLASLSRRQKILIAAGVLLVVVIGFWVYFSVATRPATEEGVGEKAAQEKGGWFWKKKVEEAPPKEEVKSEDILKTIKIGNTTIDIKKEPPKITIVSPGVIADRNVSKNRAPYLRSMSSFIEITGQVSPWDTVLKINGVKTKLNKLGGFNFFANLKEGKNEFKFAAAHKDMGETKITRYIIFHDEEAEIAKKKANLEKKLEELSKKYRR